MAHMKHHDMPCILQATKAFTVYSTGYENIWPNVVQAMKAGYTLALAAHCSAAPQAPQLLQGSLPQGPQLDSTQPHALLPYQQAVPQDFIMSEPACSGLVGATAQQPHAASMLQQPSSVVWEGTNQQPPHPGHCQAPQARASAGTQQSVAKLQESDDISCAQGQAASPVLAEQPSRNSACWLNQSASGKAEESDPDFARLGGPGPLGGVSAGQAQGKCAGASSAAKMPLQGRAIGPKATAGSGMQGTPGSATAGAAAVSRSRPNGHVGALTASNKSAESDKENAATGNAACHQNIRMMS